MATSCCPKCEHTAFEVKEAPRLKGTTYALMFVQCASCGAVVGVMDYWHLPTLLGKIADKLGVKLF